MTKRNVTDNECPKCKAVVGQNCFVKSGLFGRAHSERWALLQVNESIGGNVGLRSRYFKGPDPTSKCRKGDHLGCRGVHKNHGQVWPCTCHCHTIKAKQDAVETDPDL